MKHNEELQPFPSEFPPEILVRISNFCTTRALLNMTQATKRWNELFTSDEVWQPRLKQAGIELNAAELQQLFASYNIKNYPQLYKFLISLMSKEALKNELSSCLPREWRKASLSSVYVDDIKGEFCTANLSKSLRTTALDLPKMGFEFYESLIHYHAREALNTSVKRVCRSHNSKIVEQEIRSLISDNDVLQQSLCHLNRCDLNPILGHIDNLFWKLGDQHNLLLSDSSKISTSLIRHGKDSMFFTYKEGKFLVDSNFDGGQKELGRLDEREKLQPNFESRLIIEINGSNWKLIDFSMASHEDVYCKEIFTNLNDMIKNHRIHPLLD